jgi:hypothetical protein
MKRFSLHLVWPATVVSLVMLGIAVVAAGAKSPPRSNLTGFVCQNAMDPASRAVSAKAVMRPVDGTRAMSLKFDLVEKAGGVTHSLSGAGDLGVWLRPKDPTLGRRRGDVWQLNKSVYNLEAPAKYRFRATFRWLGAHGKVLSTVVRHTGNCVQKELRPDVLVRSVTVTAVAHHPRKQRYVAVIANRGATATGAFSVLFTPGAGAPSQTATLAHLRAKSSRKLSFVGPACNAGSPPTVVADPSDQVDDYDRDNNAVTVTCPA